MKRIVLAAAIAAVLALPMVSFGGGLQTNISIEDDQFVPPNPPARDINTGSVFHWKRAITAGNEHNVRQDDKLFYSGPVETGGPADFNRRLSAGSFHFYCENHGSRTAGMQGRAKVRPSLVADPAGKPFTVVWANVETESGGAFDVRYKRGSGDWKTWKNDTTAFDAVFGRHRRPTRIVAGSVYKFQARSEKKSNPAKRSGWSPTLVVST
jgi:hypothetical protein